MATAKDGTPRWTLSPELALEWTKIGGAEAWCSWWTALWLASSESPPCECEIYEYEDPSRTAGGDDD